MRLNVNASNIFIPGTGAWHITGYREAANYGYQEAKRYGNQEVVCYSRSMYNGVWTAWSLNLFSNHSVINKNTVSTEEGLSNALNNIYKFTVDEGYYECVLRITVNGLTLASGTWYISGFRGSALYGYQEAKCYRADEITYYIRSIYNGTWTAWKNMVPA